MRQNHIPNFGAATKEFKTTAMKVGYERVKEVAAEGRKMLVDGMNSQSFPSFRAFPLSPERRAEKAAKGLDPRVLIATGHYRDSIKVLVDGKNRVSVGLPEGVMAVDDEGHPTEIPLEKVARSHEFGTRTIPARPHWRPTFEKLKLKYKTRSSRGK